MRARKLFYTMTYCMAMAAPLDAMAAHPLITDDTGTLGRGTFQFEVDSQADRDRADGHTTHSGQVAPVLTYGIADPVDLVLTVPYVWTGDENGLSDITVDVKIRFFEKNGFSLAVKPGISLPTGDDDKGLGTGRIGGRLFLLGTKEIGPWTFIANLGYIRNETSGDDEEKNLWHVSAAGTYAVNEQWKIVADVGAVRNTDKNADNDPAYALAGVIFSPTKDLDLDVGVKRELTSSETDWSLLAGIVYRF